MRLAAGLRPDPLGELQRSSRPPNRNRGRGPTFKGDVRKEKGRKEKGGGKREGEGRGKRDMEGETRLPPLYSTFGYVPDNNNHDNVYGAVITIKVIVRVHPVHLMNAD